MLRLFAGKGSEKPLPYENGKSSEERSQEAIEFVNPLASHLKVKLRSEAHHVPLEPPCTRQLA
jgi:hypothetical protein